MGDHSALRSKPLNMFCLFGDKTFGNKEREIGVDVPRLLEHPVKGGLHLFPYCIAVWTYDHTALDIGIIGQFCRAHKVNIPLGVVFAS